MNMQVLDIHMCIDTLCGVQSMVNCRFSYVICVLVLLVFSFYPLAHSLVLFIRSLYLFLVCSVSFHSLLHSYLFCFICQPLYVTFVLSLVSVHSFYISSAVSHPFVLSLTFDIFLSYTKSLSSVQSLFFAFFLSCSHSLSCGRSISLSYLFYISPLRLISLSFTFSGSSSFSISFDRSLYFSFDYSLYLSRLPVYFGLLSIFFARSFSLFTIALYLPFVRSLTTFALSLLSVFPSFILPYFR